MTVQVDRLYRFPPLSQLHAAGAAPAAADGVSGSAQATFAQAFQQGLDAGHAEGYETGVRLGKEAGYQEGLKAGKAEGVAEGIAQARARFESLAKPLDGLFAALQQLQQEYQAALRSEVVDLVAKVSRQVIRAELALQPTQILNMVNETMAALPPARDEAIEVFLNPEELARIQELDPQRASRWRLVPDSQLEPGECRVRCGEREADAGCKQRLAAVMEQVSAQLQEVEGA